MLVPKIHDKENKRGNIMATESQRKANRKYDKNNTKQLMLKLNLKTDKDILDKLNSVGNKQGYIKSLIRKDIGDNSFI